MRIVITYTTPVSFKFSGLLVLRSTAMTISQRQKKEIFHHYLARCPTASKQRKSHCWKRASQARGVEAGNIKSGLVMPATR